LPSARPNLLRAWWPATVWIGLITFESTDHLSDQNTGSILYKPADRACSAKSISTFFSTGTTICARRGTLWAMPCWSLVVRVLDDIRESPQWIRLLPVFACWDGLSRDYGEWHQSYIPIRRIPHAVGWLWTAPQAAALALAYLRLRRKAPASLSKETECEKLHQPRI